MVKFAIALVLALLLSACDNGLPTTYGINGVQIKIVGKAWTPGGDLLLVRPMTCPWNLGARAAFRVHAGEPERICLIFKGGEVREAFEHGGSLPVSHEDFEWADGSDPV